MATHHDTPVQTEGRKHSQERTLKLNGRAVLAPGPTDFLTDFNTGAAPNEV